MRKFGVLNYLMRHWLNVKKNHVPTIFLLMFHHKITCFLFQTKPLIESIVFSLGNSGKFTDCLDFCRETSAQMTVQRIVFFRSLTVYTNYMLHWRFYPCWMCLFVCVYARMDIVRVCVYGFWAFACIVVSMIWQLTQTNLLNEFSTNERIRMHTNTSNAVTHFVLLMLHIP